MSLLNLYMILHGNLGFSSIPREQYSVVLDHCYWPMVNLIENGCKMGIEFPGETLLELDSMDHSFIEKIKMLWDAGKCEIIASGYTQLIMPLAPARINMKNLQYGLETYEAILGKRPQTLFLPEQTFSRGISSLIRDAGLASIVMDWDNAAEYHHYKQETRYRPALVECHGGEKLPIIWNSSMNSYKFQRYIYGRLSLADYVESILEHVKEGRKRCLCLYGTDWEIFNYRPVTHEVTGKETDRVRAVFEALGKKNGIVFTMPSEVVKNIPPTEVVEIASPEMPVPCKNRDDYNLVRWAVSGRDNVQQNSKTFELCSLLEEIDSYEGHSLTDEDWKKAVHLWGSDFRTKTTNEKYCDFWKRMGATLEVLREKQAHVHKSLKKEADLTIRNCSGFDYPDAVAEVPLKFRQGRFRSPVGLEVEGQEVPSQCEKIEYYQDGSIKSLLLVFRLPLKAGQQKSGTLLIHPASRNDTQTVRLNGQEINIRTKAVEMVLNLSTGADIRSLCFPGVSEVPMVKYLHPVYFDNIGYSNDYFSGWTQLCNENMQVYNDTVQARFLPDPSTFRVRIPVHFRVPFLDGYMEKRYDVYLAENRVDLTCHFFFPHVSPFFLRTGITTVNPEVFSLEELTFSTINGGREIESFPLKHRTVSHTRPPTQLCSATTCLGASEGWVAVHDYSRGLAMINNKSMLYSVPMIDFKQIKDSWLMRIYHSIGESDDTGRLVFMGHSKVKLTYLGFSGSVEQVRQVAHLINYPILVVQNVF